MQNRNVERLINFRWLKAERGEYRFLTELPYWWFPLKLEKPFSHIGGYRWMQREMNRLGMEHPLDHPVPRARFFPKDERIDERFWGRVAYPYLEDGNPASFGGEEASYSPLEKSGLFRIFAFLEPGHEAMLEFMKDWGTLTLFGEGDDPERWAAEIVDLRQCVFMLDALTDDDLDRLAEAWELEKDAYSSWDGTSDFFSEGESIRDRVLDALTWSINEKLRTIGLEPVLHDDPLTKKPLSRKLTFRPRDLIGALWYQLALAVAGDKEWRSCPVCSEKFEVSLETTGHKSNKIYCSDACRQKEHRLRKVRGIEVRECLSCNRRFEVGASGYNRKREYCSAVCRQKAYRLRKKAQKTANQ